MARPREFDEDRVLDAVMETFWSRGYEGTTAQTLVDATGLGRGSLYAAYASKDGLFEQALRRYQRRAEADVEKLRAPGSALERLRDLFHDIADADAHTPERRGCLATNSAVELAGRNPQVADLVQENFGILLRGLAETVRRGQAGGQIRPDADPEALALFLFNAVQGLRVLSKTPLGRDRAKLATIIDRTLAALT